MGASVASKMVHRRPTSGGVPPAAAKVSVEPSCSVAEVKSDRSSGELNRFYSKRIE